MGGDLQIEVGWPVAAEIPPDDRVGSGTLPRGRYVVGTHIGPYEGLLAANRVLAGVGQGAGVQVGDAAAVAGPPGTSPI